MNEAIHTGACACGAVTYRLTGEPKRVGLCHCETCRRYTGAAFGSFVIYEAGRVEVMGETRAFRSSEKGRRYFCPACGSAIFGQEEGGDEIDIYAGTLDDPEFFPPDYELWAVRRLPWLDEMGGLERYDRDRPQSLLGETTAQQSGDGDDVS